MDLPPNLPFNENYDDKLWNWVCVYKLILGILRCLYPIVILQRRLGIIPVTILPDHWIRPMRTSWRLGHNWLFDSMMLSVGEITLWTESDSGTVSSGRCDSWGLSDCQSKHFLRLVLHSNFSQGNQNSWWCWWFKNQDPGTRPRESTKMSLLCLHSPTSSPSYFLL